MIALVRDAVLAALGAALMGAGVVLAALRRHHEAARRTPSDRTEAR